MRTLLVCCVPAILLAGTPAEQKIEQARSVIAKDAKRADGYNQLAMAFARRARETADPKFYEQADAELAKSFAIEADNFEGVKTQIWVLLGKHEFSQARELARKLNKKVPDDLQIYGFLTDANIELGAYDEAEKAAQWMLDLRPGNVPGLTRGAYLRELFGDIEGSLDFMKQAYTRTSPDETEDRAWIATQVGHLLTVKGDFENAQKAFENALKLYPEYHYALGGMGRLYMAQKQYAAAVEPFRNRFRVAPHPENQYELAVALHKSGKAVEGKKVFAEFYESALKESSGPDNSNRELIFYYLDYGKKPAEGLKLAKKEAELKQDVFTLDSLAWAYHRNGNRALAKETIEKALAVGTRDPTIVEHAAAIKATSSERRRGPRSTPGA